MYLGGLVKELRITNDKNDLFRLVYLTKLILGDEFAITPYVMSGWWVGKNRQELINEWYLVTEDGKEPMTNDMLNTLMPKALGVCTIEDL